jgi:hypothetical protein
LEIKKNQYEYETVNEKNEKQFKVITFNEKNSLWMKFRGYPFVVALQTILKEFGDFVNNNAASKVQKGELEGLDVEKMAEIVRNMPAYQEKINEYSFHVHLLEKSAAFFKSRELVNATELEQCVVTGVGKIFCPLTR